MTLKSMFALVALCALAFPAFAQEEPFPAGGITLDPAVNVEIAKQDVYLSIRKVRVTYEYRSDQAQTVTMRFVNPIVPMDGGPDHLGGLLLEDQEGHLNYTRLKITADGKTVEPEVHEYAYFMGEDITPELMAAGVPAFIDPTLPLTAILATLDAAAKAEMVERGWLILDEAGEPSYVTWVYQTIMAWQQPLAAGTTAVEIAYEPLNGYPSGADPAYYGEGEDAAWVGQVRDFYCIDGALTRAVKKKMEKEPAFELVQLGYAPSIEERARTVESFTLTVDKAETAADMGGPLSFVAFCPADATKVGDLQFQWAAKDYRPQDVNVAFYSFADRFEN
ncbi:MAG TPA: DUF4424 family protein [Devosia sp.]